MRFSFISFGQHFTEVKLGLGTNPGIAQNQHVGWEEVRLAGYFQMAIKSCPKKQNPVEAKKSQHDTKLTFTVREPDGNDPARHRNSCGFCSFPSGLAVDLKVETGMYTVSIGLLWGMPGVMKGLTKTYASNCIKIIGQTARRKKGC